MNEAASALAARRDPQAAGCGGRTLAQAMSDTEVLALARAQHRAIVTNNLRDYRPLHNEAIVPGGDGHCGMIFMPGTYRRTKAEIGRIIAALEATLAHHPGENDLANGEAWL
jgi:hypothetical protein